MQRHVTIYAITEIIIAPSAIFWYAKTQIVF